MATSFADDVVRNSINSLISGMFVDSRPHGRQDDNDRKGLEISSEDETKITYEIELPGFKKDEITIKFKAGKLNITGEKSSGVRRSRSLSMPVPSGTLPESFHITMECGVLYINIDKKAIEAEHTIEISDT